MSTTIEDKTVRKLYYQLFTYQIMSLIFVSYYSV
jgi:hypothetical protein